MADGEVRGRMHRAVDVLVDEPAVAADPARLPHLAATSGRLRAWLDSVDAALAVAADRHAAAGQSWDAATVLGNGGRRSRREAEAAADRGRAATVVPALGAALAEGSVSAGHLDALAAAAARLNDAERARLGERGDRLVEAAQRETPEEFARTCRGFASQVADDDGLRQQERLRRQRNVARWTDRDGMCHTRLSLDPEADAKVWSAIRQAMSLARAGDQTDDDDRTFEQLQADVVVDLLRRSSSVDGHRPAAEITVLIDLATLLDHAHAASARHDAVVDGRTAANAASAATAGRRPGVCETSDGQPLPVETVRRLCCDGHLLPVVLGGASEVLDVGRASRLATPSQRRALRAMYVTCAHPQCRVRFDDCRIHHVVFWKLGGRTDLIHLAPVCERHHHLVHEGGWTLTLTPDRTATWYRSDGTIAYRTTGGNRRRCGGPGATADQDSGGVTATDARSDVETGTTTASNLRVMADAVAAKRATTAAAAAPSTPLNETPSRLFDPAGLAERGPPAA